MHHKSARACDDEQLSVNDGVWSILPLVLIKGQPDPVQQPIRCRPCCNLKQAGMVAMMPQQGAIKTNAQSISCSRSKKRTDAIG